MVCFGFTRFCSDAFFTIADASLQYSIMPSVCGNPVNSIFPSAKVTPLHPPCSVMNPAADSVSSKLLSARAFIRLSAMEMHSLPTALLIRYCLECIMFIRLMMPCGVMLPIGILISASGSSVCVSCVSSATSFWKSTLLTSSSMLSSSSMTFASLSTVMLPMRYAKDGGPRYSDLCPKCPDKAFTNSFLFSAFVIISILLISFPFGSTIYHSECPYSQADNGTFQKKM